ncbi:MAG TPA: hypothetical protein VJ890_21035 [Vineibacter sp.]|nr:hypothetical protein [Vineibacter sp.]
MRLASARELKQTVVTRLIVANETVIRAARLSVATTEHKRLSRINRTVALGVSPYGKEYRLAVRVQEQALLDSPVVDRIRKEARGEIDVRFVGRIRKRQAPWYRCSQRPLLIGTSIGHHDVTAGTIGAMVKKRRSNDPLVLSNNHVLANEDRARVGDVILQPGSLDGGRRRTSGVGSLLAFVRLTAAKPNRVDAAVAELDRDVPFDPTKLRGLGRLAGLGPSAIEDGARVAKIGRTTGLTKGRVTAFEIDNVVVEYDRGNLVFNGQIEIEGASSRPFSDGGDSGSLIVNADQQAIALLFAGTDSGGRSNRGLTYANPIGEVLSQLRVELFV